MRDAALAARRSYQLEEPCPRLARLRRLNVEMEQITPVCIQQHENREMSIVKMTRDLAV